MVTLLEPTPAQLLASIILFYLVLGCFMETLSMMVATVPITTPLIVHAGYDPIWYGVLVVILMETAMVTPPIGINLFVVQGVRRRGQIHDVILGAIPFVVTLLTMVALICIFPELVLWLPEAMR